MSAPDILSRMSSPASSQASRTEVTRLVEFALAALPRYERPDEPGIFCWERRVGEPAPQGRSLRYSLMALLGLLKAREHGYSLGIDPDAVHQALLERLDDPELDPGDFGLYLWADSRVGGSRGGELVERLERALAANDGLPARLGMEIGWIVTGLAHQVAAGAGASAEQSLARALDQLLGANRAGSSLFRHHGAAGTRRRFPNFATQIYAVLALSVVARHELDPRALPAARACADRLLDLQLSDGGWPWLFDAERGTVVERYEVYSVHQQAMAPMGLLELTEVTGDERLLEAVGRGLRWIWGVNELARDMVVPSEHIVLRSIRRRRGPDRFWLATKTAASLIGLPTAGSAAHLTEVNPTDRPYSMGWILEAWCGREGAIDS
jgi:hypothetical protein